jgi:hypothetical protein
VWKSRNLWRSRADKQRRCIQTLQAQLKLARGEIERLDGELQMVRQQREQRRHPEWEPQSFRPIGPALPGHQYSPAMIALCCRLSLLIGFRAVPKVLWCILDAFGLEMKIPSRDAVRNWNCRNGVAILREAEKADDWIWMIDHSVQLGKMFVLAVLGIRQSNLPEGKPLRRQDMQTLAVMPTTSRKAEEVSKQLHSVADEFGVPLAVLCDGAPELHGGVESLQSLGFRGVCLDDVKHKAANLLKRTLGRNQQWKAFEAELGRTTAAIGQTGLEHLLPPRKKQKSRFMNFDRLIDWAVSVQKQLDTAGETSRLVQKLGWLNDFQDDLARWQEARAMIGRTLHQANDLGIWIGSTGQLTRQLEALPAGNDWVVKIRCELIAINARNESKLESLGSDCLHLPCSTELLESAFGSFKSIQVHHNRGTFTSLLATFPTLFDNCTAEKIRKRFASVNNKDVKTWLEQAGLTDSTQSRRMKAKHHAKAPLASETCFSKA